MKRFVGLLTLMSCGVPAQKSSPLAFKDIKRADVRSDGLYNVICMDDQFEIGVSRQQIIAGAVCNGKPSEGPKDCSTGSPMGSAHELAVEQDKTTGKYRIAFANAKDSHLRAISMYVTGKDDSIPIFPKFEFKGTAYWMVAVDDPFEESLTLPLTYGSLPKFGIDVTEAYKGKSGGALLNSVTSPTCIKFSVVTFEPEEAEAFKTSTYLRLHTP